MPIVVSESFPCLAASGRASTIVARLRALSFTAGRAAVGVLGGGRAGGAASRAAVGVLGGGRSGGGRAAALAGNGAADGLLSRRLARRSDMTRAAGAPCWTLLGGATAARSAAARRALILATASASSQAVERRPSMSMAGGKTGSGRTYWDGRTRTPARRAASATLRKRSNACCGIRTSTGWIFAARHRRVKRCHRARDTLSAKGLLSPSRC